MSNQRSGRCAGLYDALGDGVLSAGVDAKIIDINERFSGLVGADRKQLRGSSSASVIRLAFGLSEQQWVALERGQAQRVRAGLGTRQEHELLRLEESGEPGEPVSVVYVVRDVGYAEQAQVSAERQAQLCEPDCMMRQVYEWVARCWADRRPFALLGIHRPSAGQDAQAMVPPELVHELLDWAGEEARVGALPVSMFETLRGQVPAIGASTQWQWVTLPGVSAEECQDWLDRVWHGGLRGHCPQTEIFGASLAGVEDAPLPRVESWVMQGFVGVLEQLVAPIRAHAG